MSPIVGTGVMMGLSTGELILPNVTKKIQKIERREVLDRITPLHCVCVCLFSVRERYIVFGSMSIIHTTFRKFVLLLFDIISCHYLHSRNYGFKSFARRIFFIAFVLTFLNLKTTAMSLDKK